MALSTLAWKAIILAVVILFLTFLPNGSFMAIVILLGRIAQALKQETTSGLPGGVGGGGGGGGGPGGGGGGGGGGSSGDPLGDGGGGDGGGGGDPPGGGDPLLARWLKAVIHFWPSVLEALAPVVDAPASALVVDAAGKTRRKPESSSTSSPLSGIDFEVFLNFRSPDTGKGFADHLYHALISAGIRVFRDNQELRLGDPMHEIKEAILQSRISIAILSKNFAFSKRCLNELVQMWECRESNGQIIVPIFYDVSPMDVRHCVGDFERSFNRHKENRVGSNTIETWKQVLREIGSSAGFELLDGYEGELVKRVVAEVEKVLKKDGRVVADKLIGIDLHVEEIMRKLGVTYSEGQATEVRGEDVRVVGICGVRGVGKTILAMVVFNKMRKLFDANSFLEDISSKGVQFSRRRLIVDLRKQRPAPPDLKEQKPAPLESPADEIEEIASLCRNARVLIVLDNVDEDEQIKELAGKLTWFGPGSKIIVTTNKKKVLNAFGVGADDRGTVEEHEVNPMGRDHALQLFCKHAFHGAAVQDVSEYFGLSVDIVKAIEGFPSDIVHHASYLRHNMNIDTWRSTLKLLQEVPKDRQDAVDAPAPTGKERKKQESSSTSPSSSGIKYGVFLNFRGSDTRTMADHLYRELVDAGISVFKDVEELNGGEEIWPQVKEAINRSRISIAILSADYPSSKSCLDELVQMRECRKLNGQSIIPIFYNISPSDVRHLAGDFGEAFNLHETAKVDSGTIKKWREVLQETGELPGYSGNLYKGYEGQLVEVVAVRVARILRDDGLVVKDKLVGIDLHVQDMMRKLGVAYSEGQVTEVRGEDDVRVVGICGVPGVGKTTLAKVVFNKMRELFDACSFLSGISSKGVQFSRHMLMADLQLEKPAPLKYSGEGIDEIASLCHNVKVLIVLDDVDEDEQINALAGKLTWFGPGSRIIVTTNKREVLSAFVVGVGDRMTVEEHKVKPMGCNHALQLFCEHAFQGAAVQDVSEYFGLSVDIVKAIEGLPSDIVHHASALHDNMNIDTWRRTLKFLQFGLKDRQDAVDAPAPFGKERKEQESSSTSSSSSEFKHDVYLSFREPDVGHNFLSDLCRHLRIAGIKVRRVDDLDPRKEILPKLGEEIKKSRISIVILSENYAFSKSCLMELVQMWKCRELNGKTIIPIFYHVSPSEVREQAEEFGSAFNLHEIEKVDSKSIDTWKEVLRQIAGLKGYIREDLPGWNDGQLVKKVVARVVQVLNNDGPVVTDELVEIDLDVQEMMKKLGLAYSKGQAIEARGEEVRVVGIYGVPGVGKTTLAKVVYNKLRKLFDAYSFLEDIRSEGVQFSRHKLIADLKKQIPAPLESSGEEIEEIASLCRNAKVLIVLDDVDEDEQIKELAGKLTWFNPGSRIIVTTNKKEVLSAFDIGADDCGTVEEHKVEPMSDEHALQLFRNHVFQGYAPKDVSKYESLSIDIVKAIGRLPSVIEDHASFFHCNMNLNIWRLTLDLLQKSTEERLLFKSIMLEK